MGRASVIFGKVREQLLTLEAELRRREISDQELTGYIRSGDYECQVEDAGRLFNSLENISRRVGVVPLAGRIPQADFSRFREQLLASLREEMVQVFFREVRLHKKSLLNAFLRLGKALEEVQSHAPVELGSAAGHFQKDMVIFQDKLFRVDSPYMLVGVLQQFALSARELRRLNLELSRQPKTESAVLLQRARQKMAEAWNSLAEILIRAVRMRHSAPGLSMVASRKYGIEGIEVL